MKILITGTAGFIGFHLAKQLLNRGDEVIGIDNINDYYDVDLKYARLAQSGISIADIEYGKEVTSLKFPKYRFIKIDICDREALDNCFKNHHFDAVCNLAAQAGVRYSLTNPEAYIEANIKGFLNILECSRHFKIEHLLYASSSSVYGLNKKMPFSAHDHVDHPVSLYAASKKSNELMAHSYSHLFNLPTTALRFFTVYGPWGRPDMALYLFTKAIFEGKPIEIFNNGNMRRDFTYVDDIVEGIVRIFDQPAHSNPNWDNQNPDPASSSAPFSVYNIGRGAPVSLMEFIESIEMHTGITAQKLFLPMQDGDVAETAANIDDLKYNLHYEPKVSVNEGVKNFVKWYTEYYALDIAIATKKETLMN